MENTKDVLEKINFSHAGIITREIVLVPFWTAQISINSEMNTLLKNYTYITTHILYRQYFL